MTAGTIISFTIIIIIIIIIIIMVTTFDCRVHINLMGTQGLLLLGRDSGLLHWEHQEAEMSAGALY
jgi:hypothetical protein